ncbi:MAG: hypothetical protein KJ056_01890 [Acidimicrobiia bacterium]|nr:hypothetical protein [Acidimicrobiia bacterium]
MSTAFKICLLLHVLSAVAAFGPAFAFPFASRAGNEAAAAMLKATQRVMIPAMVGVIVFGALAVVASDDAFEMSDAFVSIGFVLAFLAVGVAAAIVLPAQRRLSAGERAAGAGSGDGAGSGGGLTDEGRAALRGRVAGGTGALHLILLVAVIIMIWKP